MVFVIPLIVLLVDEMTEWMDKRLCNYPYCPVCDTLHRCRPSRKQTLTCLLESPTRRLILLAISFYFSDYLHPVALAARSLLTAFLPMQSFLLANHSRDPHDSIYIMVVFAVIFWNCLSLASNASLLSWIYWLEPFNAIYYSLKLTTSEAMNLAVWRAAEDCVTFKWLALPISERLSLFYYPRMCGNVILYTEVFVWPVRILKAVRFHSALWWAGFSGLIFGTFLFRSVLSTDQYIPALPFLVFPMCIFISVCDLLN